VGDEGALHGRRGHHGTEQDQRRVDLPALDGGRAAAGQTGGDDDGADDGGDEAEEDAGVPEGGIHRDVPLGALTRLGYLATYWAVWSTMI
jgi:hypothetical protein